MYALSLAVTLPGADPIQPGEHLYMLSFAFTSLVFFSATQGEFQHC